jgi:hypothetical protein
MGPHQPPLPMDQAALVSTPSASYEPRLSARLPRPASIDRRACEAHQLPFGLRQSVRPGSGLGSIPSRLSWLE